MSNKVPGTFRSLFDEIARLRVYGANSVFRRATAIAAEFVRAEADGSLAAVEMSPTRRPCNGWDPLPARGPWQPLKLEQVVSEVQQDSLRRTVFLDPNEAAIAALADLFSGKLRVLEFRDTARSVPLAELEQKARQLLVNTLPAVAVNVQMGGTKQELIHSLRYMADQLQKSSVSDLAGLSYEYKGNAATSAGTCNFQQTEKLGSRWSNNGTKLEFHFRDVYQCVTHDPCCGNPSYHTEYQNDRWEVSWEDSGNSATPPPVNPPDYQSSPWGNRLPVYTDPAIGTLTSDYGWRTVSGSTDFHAGIDIAAGANSNVQSNVAGTIVHISQGGAGSAERGVIIRDANNITHTYWHISPANTLQNGDTIAVGDRLGATYDWGTRTHLHYAEHAPPGGDWTQRNDANSRNPLP